MRRISNLDSFMRCQKVRRLCRVSDVGVDDGARRNVFISAKSSVVFIDRKESGVVTLLNDEKCDSRFESVLLQFFASALNGAEFFVEDLIKLALTDTVTEVDYPFGFATKMDKSVESLLFAEWQI